MGTISLIGLLVAVLVAAGGYAIEHWHDINLDDKEEH